MFVCLQLRSLHVLSDLMENFYHPMHPQDFRSILNHIFDIYSTLNDELSRLRKENKMLSEELNKIRSLNMSLNARLSDITIPKIQKMGAEWHIEGEILFDMTLYNRIRLNSPICNCRISNRGQIAFTCSGKIFLYSKDFFIVEETIEEYDFKELRQDLIDMERRAFDFIGEDLVVYNEGRVNKFSGNEKEWFLELPGVTMIRTDRDLIYIGVEGGSIHVYNMEGDFIKTYKHNRDIDQFQVKEGNLVVVLDRSIAFYYDETKLQDCLIQKYDSRILGVDLEGDTVYTSHENGESRVIKVTKDGLETIHKMIYKKPVLSIRKFKKYIFVGVEDRKVRIIDLDSKKEMEVVLPDNVIEIEDNGEKLCFVDNNGGMRIWGITERI